MLSLYHNSGTSSSSSTTHEGMRGAASTAIPERIIVQENPIKGSGKAQDHDAATGSPSFELVSGVLPIAHV
jgi:hypothetical protein